MFGLLRSKVWRLLPEKIVLSLLCPRSSTYVTKIASCSWQQGQFFWATLYAPVIMHMYVIALAIGSMDVNLVAMLYCPGLLR